MAQVNAVENLNRQSAAAVPVITNAETVAITTPAMNAGASGNPLITIRATLNVTTGTGATSLSIIVRRGAGVGGAIIYNQPHSMPAANTAQLSIEVFDAVDNLNKAGGGQYTISIVQNSATGNGTINYASCAVDQ